MHQVLSYETAVRANSSREFREYVSKRTCASLVLTIGFFMLITGECIHRTAPNESLLCVVVSQDTCSVILWPSASTTFAR